MLNLDTVAEIRYCRDTAARGETGRSEYRNRSRCRLGALERQTDASPTIRWCLVVISMAYLMRRNRADARRSLDANFDRTAFRESDVTLRSAVTVTVQAEAVGLRTNRLSHHRMMAGNVWDGWKLVRRSYYGRCSRVTDLLTQALSRRGRNVT